MSEKTAFNKIRELAFGILVLIIAGVMLTIDLLAPSFDLPSIVYLVPLVLSAYIDKGKYYKLLLAATCTAFIVTGYFWHNDFVFDMGAATPRAIAIVGVWIVAIVVMNKDIALDQITRRESRLDSLVSERTQDVRFNLKRQKEALKAELSKQKQDLQFLKEKASRFKAARQRAENATKARTELLSRVSRQMGASLRSISDSAATLKETTSNSDQQRHIEGIHFTSETLYSTTADLQSLYSLEYSGLKLQQRPFTLQTILEKALELLGTELSANQVQLVASIDPSTPTTFFADDNRVRQVLTSLIGAVSDFSHGSSVSVLLESLESSSKTCHLHGIIHSTQASLSEEELKTIFRIFGQSHTISDPPATRREMLLYLGSRLCKAMKGKVWIEHRNGIEVRIQFAIELDLHSEQQPRLSGEGWFSEKHLIIVDDHKPTRNGMARILKSWGFQCTTLPSGQDAIRWLAAGKPCDLVLMDMDMPGLDGLTVARKINQHKPRLPIVLLTSYGERIHDPSIRGSIFKPILQSPLYHRLIELFTEPQPSQPASMNDMLSTNQPVKDIEFERGPSNWLYDLTNFIDQGRL